MISTPLSHKLHPCDPAGRHPRACSRLRPHRTCDSGGWCYTFHAPDSPLSLGNDIETIIGPGDSGGPALRASGDGWELVGINTFVEGCGGRFGDIGGGVALDPYWDWVDTTTGIPEPETALMWMLAV